MHGARVAASCFCVVLLSVAPAFAQHAGVEAGFSMSRVSPDAAGQSITRGPGVLGGVWIQVQPWVPIGIQIEAIYAQKHSHLTSTTDLKLDYFEVPILAKLKLFKSIYMLEGIALGFPVSAKLSTASGTDTDIKDQIHRPDLGMVIGGGVPVSKKVAIEFRYEGGFQRISDVATAALQRNRSLSGILRITL